MSNSEKWVARRLDSDKFLAHRQALSVSGQDAIEAVKTIADNGIWTGPPLHYVEKKGREGQDGFVIIVCDDDMLLALSGILEQDGIPYETLWRTEPLGKSRDFAKGMVWARDVDKRPFAMSFHRVKVIYTPGESEMTVEVTPYYDGEAKKVQTFGTFAVFSERFKADIRMLTCGRRTVESIIDLLRHRTSVRFSNNGLTVSSMFFKGSKYYLVSVFKPKDGKQMVSATFQEAAISKTAGLVFQEPEQFPSLPKLRERLADFDGKFAMNTVVRCQESIRRVLDNENEKRQGGNRRPHNPGHKPGSGVSPGALPNKGLAEGLAEQGITGTKPPAADEGGNK